MVGLCCAFTDWLVHFPHFNGGGKPALLFAFGKFGVDHIVARRCGAAATVG